MLGFGVVKVDDTHAAMATATRVKAVGLTISDQPGLRVGLGYASSSVVSVKTNANIVVEVEPATVTVHGDQNGTQGEHPQNVPGS